jgi:hypothetical protein
LAATTSSSSEAPTPGVVSVLLPQTQHGGSWTSGQFASTPTWTVGWAYACTRLTTGPALQIYVVTSGSKAAQPLVAEPALNGSGTTHATGTGEHILQIESNPYCTSAVKVVGPAP